MPSGSDRKHRQASRGGSSELYAIRRASAQGGDARVQGRRVLTRGFQRWLLAVFVTAPLLAFGIQLVRAPEEVPQVVSVVKPRVIAPLIVGSLANPQGTTLEFSLEEINAHLLQILPATSKKASGWVFQRATMRFESERCHFQTLYHWRGFELHLRVTYSVTLQSGRLQIRPFSASLGRVPLGMFWIKKLEGDVLRKLLPLMKKEQVLLSRLETLRIEPGRVLLKVRSSSTAADGYVDHTKPFARTGFHPLLNTHVEVAFSWRYRW